MRTFIILTLCLLLTGCMARTLQEEKASMMHLNPIQLCTATGAVEDFTGWGKNRAAAARQLINQRGIECDWAAVEILKQQRRSAAMANTPAIMQMLNQNLGYQTPPAFQGSTAPSGNYNSLTGTTVQQNGAITQQGAGFLVEQSTYGGVRNCYYNNLGKITSVQIATAQMCPQKN